MGKSLNQLRDEIHDWAKSKGWWDPHRTREFGTLIALCHSELSEALEAARTGMPENHTVYLHKFEGVEPHPFIDFIVQGNVGKPEGVPSELADTIIRILDLCGYYGIDIERILDEKMLYNETRAHRHGGKTM